MPTPPPVSLWMDNLALPIEPLPPLLGSHQVDVAIVGAGYTGLWTAYYLKRQAPHLRIAIVEAEYAGFGASGRNGRFDSRQGDAAYRTTLGARRASVDRAQSLGAGTLPLARLQRHHPQLRP